MRATFIVGSDSCKIIKFTENYNKSKEKTQNKFQGGTIAAMCLH